MTKTSPKLAVAVLEQVNLAKSLDRAPRGQSLVAECTFHDNASFESGLRACMSKFLVEDADTIKMLVISAHGDEETGWLKATDDDEGELVSLERFASYFKTAPINLIVYLRACFGGYPDMQALQCDPQNKPIVVGPLVEIEVPHASDFQKLVLAKLGQGLGALEAVKEAVDQFNRPDGHGTKYSGMFVYGMCDGAGDFHPIEAQGAQLRAVVEPYRTFEIIDFVPPGPPAQAIKVRLRTEGGEECLAGVGPLLSFLNKRPGAKHISARVQIIPRVPAPGTFLVGGDDLVIVNVRAPKK